MDIVLFIFGVFWVLGYVRQLAIFHSTADAHKIEYPSKGVKNILPVVLFFTWPYFLFYN